MKKLIIILLCFFSIFFFSKPSQAKGFGIGKIEKGERPILPRDMLDSFNANNAYYIGSDSKEIYLTFDCGYENGYTNQILDTLKENDVKAMFFITGHYLTSSTEIVKRMVKEGHLVGNHTYYHKDFSKIDKKSMTQEIKMLEEEYKKLIGEPISPFFRFPEGSYTDEALKHVNSLGYTSAFWSLAYKDWDKNSFNGGEYSYKAVMNKMHNGAIILMHTVSKDNATDLNKIIIDLKNSDYKFKSLFDIKK